MDLKHKGFRVLLFPWLAHGHISPFLELAKCLARRDFHVYLCSTAINLSFTKLKIPPDLCNSIEFIELQLPIMDELPPQYHTTNGLPPNLMATLKKALRMSTPNFVDILKTLNPDLLIYDYFQSFAPAAAASLDIPAVQFLPCSAAMMSFVMLVSKGRLEFPFPEIHLRGYELARLSEGEDPSREDGRRDRDDVFEAFNRSSKIVLIKTLEEIEGKYINFLSDLTGKKIIPVGALVDPITSSGNNEVRDDVMKWLETKEVGSTVFVSFGSECFLSKEERHEVAHGLEQSKVNFIWAVRLPIGEKFEADKDLPRGFLDKVKDRGLLLENWAPQVEILRHPSLGGFVSHCGWGSVMESMTFGVPIIAVPMQLDQPFSARVVGAIGVGLEVERDEDGRLESEKIANAIGKVMAAGERGDDIRKKAKEISDIIRIKGDEVMNSAVREVVQLCDKRI